MDILIKGLNAFERKILTATARLYEKRDPKIRLTSDDEVATADVIIVDSRDPQAMSWSNTHKSVLDDKTVIWIDKKADKDNHADLKRPVLWVNLPIIITRILDDLSVKEVDPYYATETATRDIAARRQAKPAPAPKPTTTKASIHTEQPFARSRPQQHSTQRTQSPSPQPTPAATPQQPRRAPEFTRPVFTPDAVRDQKSVLIVDDSLAIRNYLSSLLEQEGYAVQTAEDGVEGLHLFEGNSFDCIFMDVMMPGIDGYEACRKIKGTAKGKQVPVIMLTGKGSPFDRIRGKMAGCNAYLVKPVNVSKLKETLKAHTKTN